MNTDNFSHTNSISNPENKTHLQETAWERRVCGGGQRFNNRKEKRNYSLEKNRLTSFKAQDRIQQYSSHKIKMKRKEKVKVVIIYSDTLIYIYKK